MRINIRLVLVACSAALVNSVPYIPGEGLIGEINGLSGENATLYYYDGQLESSTHHFKSLKDPNKCQEEEARKYLHCNWHSKYRNIDGTCNNYYRPFHGALGECLTRFTSAAYDGRGDYRKSLTGNPLPLPRNVSLNIFTDLFRPAQKNVSMMFTVFGQYVAHDVSLIEFESIEPNASCCDPEHLNNPSCLNLYFPADDPYYSQFNLTCLILFRAMACASCGTGKREIKNNQTTAIDASITYAGHESLLKQLRTFDGTGRLKTESTSSGKLLPSGRPEGDLFCPRRLDKQCFKAGDVRVNQHDLLTSIQTVFVVEHNRIASVLKGLNRFWSDEKLFQEARRIVIAQLQSITYKEYLPLLLGPKYMESYELKVGNTYHGSRFDPRAVLATRVEFTAAAFRIHSMIASGIGVSDLKFKDIYTHPQHLRDGRMAELMSGVCKAASQKYGRHLPPDTTNHLYQLADEQHGRDLVATDIQRSRDMGVAPYVDLIQYCSDSKQTITSFEQLSSLMSDKHIQLLKKNYEKVEDVDLYVGVQLENFAEASLLGPTASCIIGEQFYHYKFGDRFYWEHLGEASSFTYAQRNALSRSSVSRLLCDNVQGITEVPLNAFVLPSEDNPIVPCKSIPKVDLSAWKEQFYYYY